jgi:peptidoglycan/LPS O-acetylase OafA/YrhL
MTFFWRWDSTTTPGDYDLHLWTIPTEFRCSMVLFLTLIATSRLQTRWRLTYVIALMTYCIATNRRDVMLFLAGMLLAEIDMIRTATHSTALPTATAPREVLCRKYNYLQPAILFVMGLFLASSPVIEAPLTPGYRSLCTLLSWLPSSGDFLGYPGSLLQCIGGILITWSVATSAPSSFIASVFTNPVAQYLGRISYALYLVHGNVLKSLLYTLMPTIAFHNRRVRIGRSIRYSGYGWHDAAIRGSMANGHAYRVTRNDLDGRLVLESRRHACRPLCEVAGRASECGGMGPATAERRRKESLKRPTRRTN